VDHTFSAIWYALAYGKRIHIEVSLEAKSLIEQADRQIRARPMHGGQGCRSPPPLFRFANGIHRIETEETYG